MRYLLRQKTDASANGSTERVARLLPLGALLLALATVFAVGGDRGYFYHAGKYNYNQLSAKNMALAENFDAAKGFLFLLMRRGKTGEIRYDPYNRFPIGGMLLIALAIAPFAGDLSTQIVAARVLMLGFFCAAAVLAYLSLARITRDRAASVAATLLAFSSYHMLDYNDMITTELFLDLFGVLFVFHGMVVFAQEGRFAQLVAKTGAAILLGWHAYAVLAPLLACGLAGELARAWREGTGKGLGTGGGRWRETGRRLLALAGQALRSRYTLLGGLALLFGVAALGYNFAVEYAAYGGERAMTELPSVRSAFRRTGLHPGFRSLWQALVGWLDFLAWQFHRVGVMMWPFGLAIGGGSLWDEMSWRAAGAAPLTGAGIAATVLCLAVAFWCRAFRGWRGRVACMALGGFFWAVPMRHQAGWAGHDHETVFHFGIPLVVFTGMLLGIRHLSIVLPGAGGASERLARRRRVAVGCAFAAMLVFAWSNVRAAAVGPDAHFAARERALMAEFEAIREITSGSDVLVQHHNAIFGPAPQRRNTSGPQWDATIHVASSWDAFCYYMAGSVLHLPRTVAEAARLEASGKVDFVLGFKPRGGESVPLNALTPDHRFVFLYRPGGVTEAITRSWRREYQTATASEPRARGEFDVFLEHLEFAEQTPTRPKGARRLVYAKHPCRNEDTLGRFFLDLVPTNRNDLTGAARASGLAHVSFPFNHYGVLFDNHCLIDVPLPDFPIETVYTGRYAPGQGPLVWRTAFRADLETLRRAYELARGLAPAARSTFALYLRGDRLTYIREPCAPADVEARFFLHVSAANAEALPETRRAAGFDNLDFEFNERGALFDGKCVADVRLPHYPIRAVTTGQFAADVGELWRARMDVASHVPYLD